jgi:hypothetical protein
MARHVEPTEHDALVERHQRRGSALLELANQLADMTRDRDEWKLQHENLLAIYRAQTEELAAQRGGLPQGDDRAEA